MILLDSAKIRLQYCAIKWVQIGLPSEDDGKMLQDMRIAAKRYTDTVNSINPKLWEPCPVCPESIEPKKPLAS